MVAKQKFAAQYGRKEVAYQHTAATLKELRETIVRRGPATDRCCKVQCQFVLFRAIRLLVEVPSHTKIIFPWHFDLGTHTGLRHRLLGNVS